MKIIWSLQASSARNVAIEFIAKESMQAADQQIAEIERQTDMLLKFPELGRPGRIANTRELVISKTPFILIYRINLKEKRIQVFRFIHSSQYRVFR